MTGEHPRRIDCNGSASETYILDVDAHAARHAELTSLVRRINGFDSREEGLRQSAAHLKEFLLARKKVGIGGAVASTRSDDDPQDADVRILGIATLHCTHSPFSATLAERAGLPSKAAREETSALLCAEFMERLTELGARQDVERIDWVVVRVGDDPAEARAHLGATRVTRVDLQPFAPGVGPGTASTDAETPAAEATAANSSAAPAPAT